MVGSEFELQPTFGREAVDGFGARLKRRLDRMQSLVGADDLSPTIEQRIDADPPFGGGHECVAGYTRIRSVDLPAVRAGVPIVDRAVVLHAGVRAGPSR